MIIIDEARIQVLDNCKGELWRNTSVRVFLQRRLLLNTSIRLQWKLQSRIQVVTNFIQPYLHRFFIDSHGINGYGKPLKKPFNRYQSCLEAIDNGQDIRQINW